MSILEIPVKSDFGTHEFEITIENKLYNFKFSYNKRSSRWMYSIFDSNKNPILQNIVMLTNVDITHQFRHLDIPKGVFMVIDSLNEESNPTEFDWEQRNFFLYSEAS